jgi:signal transduction histidine kinase/ligand-binding sensor domain-containing protein/DNA-binding NarL/FixJ family response regulator
LLLLWYKGLAFDQRVTTADGLSNDFVVGLAIDGQGYVWVATEAGVNRIAGKMCQPFPQSALTDGQRITAIFWHAMTNQMLIGSERGLTVYRPATGTKCELTARDGLVASSIDCITMAGNDDVWLVYSSGQVQRLDCRTLKATTLNIKQTYRNRCALDDGQGHLYIGHSQNGMSIVDISDGTMRHYESPSDQRQGEVANRLPGNNVRKIFRDDRGRIWVGTDNGMARFLPATGTFEKVAHADGDYDYNVYDILQSRDGTLWVATDIGGVVGLSASGDMRFDHSLQLKTSSLNTRCLAQDEFGNFWVGNHSTGVDFFSAQESDFTVVGRAENNSNLHPVYALAPDVDGIGFWSVGQDEMMFWRDGKEVKWWTGEYRTRQRHSSARCVMADREGYVWVGVDDCGVFRFNRRTERFEHIPLYPEELDVLSFAEDGQGGVWIGGEAGVYHYADGKVTSQEMVNKVLKAPVSYFDVIDDHRLFMATIGDGIYLFDLANNTHRQLNIRDGLPSAKVNQAIRDRQRGLWLATDGGLVWLENPATLTGMTVYGTGMGLADSHVLALQQDEHGRIWMSTNSGISCFDKHTSRFYNYNHLDTHVSGGFSVGAAITAGNGLLCFGSAAGICCINPRNMNSRAVLSAPQISSCRAYNPTDNDTELQLLVPDGDGRVFTTYRQNTLRLTFAMRDFAQADLVDYSYMMKGMDGKWYDIGNDHDVVFRGLQPGHYTFILRAKLRSQDWDHSKETQLSIVIEPPFWRTWWAYVAYLLLTVALVAYLIRQYKRKLTWRNQLELERRESQQKQELNEERLRFFTNVTHELRTPLTLILGPLDDLMEDRDLTQQSRRRVAMIQKSAERLRNLINEILEFRKTETQNRRLTVARGDIGKFVREICLNYKELNRNPKVQLVCRIADDLPKIWFDSEIITTVMNNLLSNAMKYTDEGSITTTVEAVDGTLRIAVTDTGYGITPEALPHVFERYYQAKGRHQASGTGIGLALVKSLAELHEGSINVESHEGKGSCFTLVIDIDNTYPNALHKEDKMTSEELTVEHVESAATEEQQVEDKGVAQPQLLVVEDNADIRQYITDTFSDDFRILQAENGEEGVQMAVEHNPDIIVSDIMMPQKNGLELTRQLKGDIRTSHIPVILLTAKNADEDKEEGYDSGADSYLTKPFTAKLLASRVRNLLASRRRQAEMVANGMTPSTQHPIPNTELTPLDQDFIVRLNRLIEDHIMQEDIDMAFVTDKMAMSHSTFYRKVKALTGMTATEYIRKRRLRYCYQLLESGDYNVNQAASMTGFNQMAHFRETFKREFGILPSEVKRK